MGGIVADATTAAPLPGLYSVGECSSVGIHGANRLGSNSLTELIVFGKVAGVEAARYAKSARHGNGSVIGTLAEGVRTRALSIVTRQNGEVKQDGPISDMIHSVADIIAYASAAFTLLPGDVILTGTPAGVGPFVAGDVIEVEISGLGILRNGARDA